MPRAIRGSPSLGPESPVSVITPLTPACWHPAGVLIECDPAVKSIIVNIDSANHEYIIEDLDEQRCVVKETMVADLKQKLDEVRTRRHARSRGSADHECRN